ncbi:MAG TPA: hypothetical protein VE081_10400 [Sporichthyaceae bacterium]|nr:hypothetical protein [Sporichthyaceae bacterium]
MYTRSRRSQMSLQMSLWADAVSGSARNLQRRREMGWCYREGAGQSTAAVYAAEQAERRRTRNRRKTQAITAVIVLGVTVPAWAVVNAVSTPSAHNGLAPVSDGTSLGADTAADSSPDQFAQMLSSAKQNAPALPDSGPSDSAWASTMSAAHQFDLPMAADPTPVTQPAPRVAARERTEVAPDENAAAPDDLPDDAIVAPDEAATVPDTVALPEQHHAKSEKRFDTHKHEAYRGEAGEKPAAPAAPSRKSAGSDPAEPGSGWSTSPQTPAKPSIPTTGTGSSTPAKPAPADPAAPGAGADPASPGAGADPASPSSGTVPADHNTSGKVADSTPAGETGGGATKGEGKAADGKGEHGKVAKSDPSAP